MAKDNTNNRSYSNEKKLVARILPPENISLKDLLIKTSISKSILSTCKVKAIT